MVDAANTRKSSVSGADKPGLAKLVKMVTRNARADIEKITAKVEWLPAQVVLNLPVGQGALKKI